MHGCATHPANIRVGCVASRRRTRMMLFRRHHISARKDRMRGCAAHPATIPRGVYRHKSHAFLPEGYIRPSENSFSDGLFIIADARKRYRPTGSIRPHLWAV
ncbi:hypothetical protein [Kingella potus]|uniref:hypothetical protein n=1 Tax=Kingella potus TaxID=265175 RepID=UPI001FD55759|nr:hypothetical protein [Kingella potus]UOP01329.1 hypothetical protein LVJ84_03525 [Kingella potus]